MRLYGPVICRKLGFHPKGKFLSNESVLRMDHVNLRLVYAWNVDGLNDFTNCLWVPMWVPYMSCLRIPFDESPLLLYCYLSYNEFSWYRSLLHVFLGYCLFIGNILSDSSTWETLFFFFFFSNYHEGYLTIILIRLVVY